MVYRFPDLVLIGSPATHSMSAYLMNVTKNPFSFFAWSLWYYIYIGCTKEKNGKGFKIIKQILNGEILFIGDTSESGTRAAWSIKTSS